MEHRLRSASVVALLDALERRVTAPAGPGLFWMIDGKPLPIGGCSKDRQAGYGRAAGGKAKGYKVHALAGSGGALAAWRGGAAGAGPGGGRAAVRQLDELGRGADVPAGLGADPPAGPPVGPGQARARP